MTISKATPNNETHPTLGVPSVTYPYYDLDGNLYCQIYRFDGPTGKTIRPWQPDLRAWEFPENRLPYNIQSIHQIDFENRFSGGNQGENQFPPIIIVEGEKCVDALTEFGFLAITSMGGSNQVQKTDWNCLKGFDVIIWPDYDPSGFAYAEKLIPILKGAGIKSIKQVPINIDTLNKAKSTIGPLRSEKYFSLLKDKKEVSELKNEKAVFPLKKKLGSFFLKKEEEQNFYIEIPKGWDVADSIENGWQIEHIIALLDQAISIETQNHASIETANDNWPEPDMSFLIENDTPPPFPKGVFHPTIDEWLSLAAKGRAAPVDYIAATLLTGAASLIGNSRKISPWATWEEPCILWAALVGSPSSGKTPAMKPVFDLVKEIEHQELPKHEEALKDYEAQKLTADLAMQDWEAAIKAAYDNGDPPPAKPDNALEPEAPKRPRLLIQDATIEALINTLQHQPKGLLMHRDELAGFFANFDRYNSSKGGDRAFWLECFGGGSYTLDRVKNGGFPVTIPYLSVSIVGGIQPDRLHSCLLKGDDDGLNSRFMYFYPDQVKRQRPSQAEFKTEITLAFRALHKLEMAMNENGNPTPRTIPLSDEAADIFEQYWKALQDKEAHDKLDNWLGKNQGMALRIALVLHYLDFAMDGLRAEPHFIGADIMKRAILLMDSYLHPIAKRAFGTSSKPETDQNTLKLAKWILEEKPKTISQRDLCRGEGPFKSNTQAEIVNTAILQLSDYGWLKPNYSRQGKTLGKQKASFKVNPTIYIS